MDELVTLGECRHCVVACGDCPDVIRSTVRTAEARASYADDQLAAALRALVACASHLTTLGRPDLSPVGDYGDLIECPRCGGQTYDRGSCSLCRNVGMLDVNGEAIRLLQEPTS